MKISVIIPFLNMARFLPDAVDSVQAQQYPAWELILVDDGSTDGGGEWAHARAAEDPARICVIRQGGRQPQGASAARNLGIQQATGDGIAFMDADDIWLPGKLNRQAEILSRYPECAMTFSRVRYFFNDAEEGAERDQTFGPLREGVYAPPQLTREFLLDSDVYPCPSATLIRTEALRAVGGFEERFRKVRTDLAVWVKLTTFFPVHADPAVLTRYRQHPQSSVSKMLRDPESSYINELMFARWLLDFLETLPVARRDALADLACERYTRRWMIANPQVLTMGRIVWRLRLARHLREIPAFRRRGRWLRYLLPSRWQQGEFA